MKKNLIYTVTFLLCGAIFFSSCEDMLNVESNRVEYEFEGWTFNDSVYSVLGILKSVQKVGDRHILLNELRGDLLATNNKTLDDVLDISNYEFDTENNQYLDVKDYFSIINNCNVFLARVDTTLEYDNRRLMLREYVAVKSVRAWTYMQLMKNHAYIPYFTEPVLTHSKADEIMSAAPADHITVIDKLIEDIAPYENPLAYKMPLWEIPKFVDKSMTGKLFMPIRVLLGDLYLWRASLKAETSSYPLPYPNPNSDFAKAAQYYYTYLTEDNPQADNQNTASHRTEKPDEKNQLPSTSFLNLFVKKDIQTRAGKMVSIIHYADDENTGMTSKLASVFAPIGDAGQNQVIASPSLIGLSNRQVYNYRYYKTETSFTDYIVNSEKWPGDLRLYSVTASQRGTDINKTLYSNMVLKFNVYEPNEVMDMDEERFFNPLGEANNIILDRPENIYLRFAEALMGLEREGWTGAKELAMTVLKSGVKKVHKIYWQPDTVIEQRVDEIGRGLTADLLDVKGSAVKLLVPVLDEETGEPIIDEETGEPLTTEVKQTAPIMDLVIKSDYDPIVYDFMSNTFSGNAGIHSRGSGFTESNPYYALTDSCVAEYHNILPIEGVKETVTELMYNDDGSIRQIPVYEDEEQTTYKLDENGNVVWEYRYTEPVEVNVYNITEDLRLAYMYDKLIDEMALEMAWEGHRFGDLARMATALANPDFLAKRVAARNVKDADWRSAEGADGWDATLYGKLRDKNNWYIPLPDNYLVPTIVPVTPDAPYIPEEDPETPDTPSVDTPSGEEQTPVTPEQGDGE